MPWSLTDGNFYFESKASAKQTAFLDSAFLLFNFWINFVVFSAIICEKCGDQVCDVTQVKNLRNKTDFFEEIRRNLRLCVCRIIRINKSFCVGGNQLLFGAKE